MECRLCYEEKLRKVSEDLYVCDRCQVSYDASDIALIEWLDNE